MNDSIKQQKSIARINNEVQQIAILKKNSSQLMPNIRSMTNTRENFSQLAKNQKSRHEDRGNQHARGTNPHRINTLDGQHLYDSTQKKKKHLERAPTNMSMQLDIQRVRAVKMADTDALSERDTRYFNDELQEEHEKR